MNRGVVTNRPLVRIIGYRVRKLDWGLTHAQEALSPRQLYRTNSY